MFVKPFFHLLSRSNKPVEIIYIIMGNGQAKPFEGVYYNAAFRIWSKTNKEQFFIILVEGL